MSNNAKKTKITGFPASYAQRRMWFLSRLETDKLLNNSTIKAFLTGELDAKILEKSLQAIIKRHEAFRTNFFQTETGEVIQSIHPTRQIKMVYEDISQITVENKKTRQRELTRDNTSRIFNLSQDELIRVSLVKIKQNKHLLLITLHHIISDAWTLAFFWDELSSIYDSLKNSTPLNLPPLPVQYKDYAGWEQSPDYLERFLAQKKYWQKVLAKAPTMTLLPLDFPRPTVQTYHHSLLKYIFSKTEKEKIEEICADLQVTPYTFFLSAYFILLHELSSADDVVVGTYVANRDQAEMERVAGILLNNIAIRMRFKSDATLDEFIVDTNHKVLMAMKNKDYPFEKILEELGIKREASHAPLFNTVFQLFNRDTNLLQKTFSKCEKKVDFFNSNFFQHDLIIQVGIWESHIVLDLNFSTDLFRRATAKQIATSYQKIIRKICQKRNIKISNLKLFSKNEKLVLNQKVKNNYVTCPIDKDNKVVSQTQEKTEEIVKGVWCDVLGIEKIDRHDSFFALGGHSLLLIQIHDKLNNYFPGHLNIADLFRYYTVSALADFLVNERKSPDHKPKSSRIEFNRLLSAVKNREMSIENVVEELLDS